MLLSAREKGSVPCNSAGVPRKGNFPEVFKQSLGNLSQFSRSYMRKGSSRSRLL